jgi:PAS domain S-box-containing protein
MDRCAASKRSRDDRRTTDSGKRAFPIERFFKTHPSTIVLLDKWGRILDVNRRGEALTGYSRVALLSMKVFETLVLREDAPILSRMLADADEQGPREYRIRWRTHRGEVLYLDGSAVARRSRTGEFIAVFCTLRDVTERTQHETATRERVEAAREEERTRIARELHDELGSTLTRIRWDVEALEKEVTAASPHTSSTVRDRFAETARLVDSTIESMQRIAAELRPTILDDLGLVASLESLVQQFQRASGITCRLDVLLDDDGEGPTREHATALFRIVQEALTNVSRHARARLVNIVLEHREGQLVLEVRDDGVGIACGPRTCAGWRWPRPQRGADEEWGPVPSSGGNDRTDASRRDAGTRRWLLA